MRVERLIIATLARREIPGVSYPIYHIGNFEATCRVDTQKILSSLKVLIAFGSWLPWPLSKGWAKRARVWLT